MSNKPPAIIPMPEKVEMSSVEWNLGDRIVAGHPELGPLAAVVAGEIRLLTGRELAVAVGEASPGDILLAIDEGLSGESYRLEVGDTATIRGGHYNAVAMGTVSLLQAMTVKDDVVTVPRMTIADEPAAAYRGLLVDVARKPHSIDTLEQCIILCRWYKVRYLQLHLTDDQLFTFPSTAFPQLATPGKAYTLEQLRGLEEYARLRGVTIIPELDVPGHAKTLVDAMPELFAVEGGAREGWSVTMNFAREEVCRAIETLIDEMLEVFRSTPYFHIGADESNFNGFDQDPHFQEAYRQFGITGDLEPLPENRTQTDVPRMLIRPEEHPRAYALFLRFVTRLNEKVKACGRQTLIWEGFRPAGVDQLPRDMIVMPYHMRNYPPHWLVEDGFSLINCSVEDLYVVGGWEKPALQKIYEWDMRTFEWRSAAWKTSVLPASAPVLGGQMCAWDQAEEDELPTLRERLAVFSQRVWNPADDAEFEVFRRRLGATDAKLGMLLGERSCERGLW